MDRVRAELGSFFQFRPFHHRHAGDWRQAFNTFVPNSSRCPGSRGASGRHNCLPASQTGGGPHRGGPPDGRIQGVSHGGSALRNKVKKRCIVDMVCLQDAAVCEGRGGWLSVLLHVCVVWPNSECGRDTGGREGQPQQNTLKHKSTTTTTITALSDTLHTHHTHTVSITKTVCSPAGPPPTKLAIMDDVQRALSQEVARIIACPYPASLTVSARTAYLDTQYGVVTQVAHLRTPACASICRETQHGRDIWHPWISGHRESRDAQPQPT
jgi:hypothetical protein